MVQISENVLNLLYSPDNNIHFICTGAQLGLCKGNISETPGAVCEIPSLCESWSTWIQTQKVSALETVRKSFNACNLYLPVGFPFNKPKITFEIILIN